MKTFIVAVILSVTYALNIGSTVTENKLSEVSKIALHVTKLRFLIHPFIHSICHRQSHPSRLRLQMSKKTMKNSQQNFKR